MRRIQGYENMSTRSARGSLNPNARLQNPALFWRRGVPALRDRHLEVESVYGELPVNQYVGPPYGHAHGSVQQ